MGPEFCDDGNRDNFVRVPQSVLQCLRTPFEDPYDPTNLVVADTFRAADYYTTCTQGSGDYIYTLFEQFKNASGASLGISVWDLPIEFFVKKNPADLLSELVFDPLAQYLHYSREMHYTPVPMQFWPCRRSNNGSYFAVNATLGFESFCYMSTGNRSALLPPPKGYLFNDTLSRSLFNEDLARSVVLKDGSGNRTAMLFFPDNTFGADPPVLVNAASFAYERVVYQANASETRFVFEPATPEGFVPLPSRGTYGFVRSESAATINVKGTTWRVAPNGTHYNKGSPTSPVLAFDPNALLAKYLAYYDGCSVS